MLDSTRQKLIILGFICCIYIFSLSLFVHYEKIDLSKLKLITNNLDDSPIFDISLSNNGKCENSQKIILGHHKTKVENCNCHGKFHSGYCTYEELRNGCITIKPKKINNIHIWDGNEFCIKTNNKSYVDLLKYTVNKNEECKEGFKNCGFIDTLNHKFCIIEKENCPINSIEISKSNSPPKNGFKYKTLTLKNNKFLHFTNENINNIQDEIFHDNYNFLLLFYDDLKLFFENFHIYHYLIMIYQIWGNHLNYLLLILILINLFFHNVQIMKVLRYKYNK